jgi:hypothetical protein
MGKWAVYCAGNANYILSPNKEPIRMLMSFKHHFGEELDYVYFTDENEERLDEVRSACDAYGIKLVLGECKQHYEAYRDLQYINAPRWPDAHYWYAEAPTYLCEQYDYAIKCDGDMMCYNKFDLKSLEVENEITAAREPSWYVPYDKYCPNAGFQILNLKNYVRRNVKDLFRQGSKLPDSFNSDTPLLNWLVKQQILNVHFISAEFNYLLFDVPQVNQLSMDNIKDVKIFHFVDSKPHALNPTMKAGIKQTLSEVYLRYDK